MLTDPPVSYFLLTEDDLWLNWRLFPDYLNQLSLSAALSARVHRDKITYDPAKVETEYLFVDPSKKVNPSERYSMTATSLEEDGAEVEKEHHHITHDNQKSKSLEELQRDYDYAQVSEEASERIGE